MCCVCFNPGCAVVEGCLPPWGVGCVVRGSLPSRLSALRTCAGLVCVGVHMLAGFMRQAQHLRAADRCALGWLRACAATRMLLRLMVGPLPAPAAVAALLLPPPVAVAACRRLNALDVKLYEHAKQLVQKRRKALEAAGKLQKLPALATVAEAGATVRTGGAGFAPRC